jgi:hypothetical protein
LWLPLRSRAHVGRLDWLQSPICQFGHRFQCCLSLNLPSITVVNITTIRISNDSFILNAKISYYCQEWTISYTLQHTSQLTSSIEFLLWTTTANYGSPPTHSPLLSAIMDFLFICSFCISASTTLVTIDDEDHMSCQ